MFRTAYAARAIGALLSFATSLNVPITVVTHRNKANPFRRSSILFRPHIGQTSLCDGGDAGYRPRVRSVYYERVYDHSPEGQIRCNALCAQLKGAREAKFTKSWISFRAGLWHLGAIGVSRRGLYNPGEPNV